MDLKSAVTLLLLIVLFGFFLLWLSRRSGHVLNEINNELFTTNISRLVRGWARLLFIIFPQLIIFALIVITMMAGVVYFLG